LIAKCKTTDQIWKVLKKEVRKDKDGMPLPSYQQYRWDDYYKIIKVHKRPYIKFKGEGIPIKKIKEVDIQ
jgi:hypothetical protein